MVCSIVPDMFSFFQRKRLPSSECLKTKHCTHEKESRLPGEIDDVNEFCHKKKHQGHHLQFHDIVSTVLSSEVIIKLNALSVILSEENNHHDKGGGMSAFVLVHPSDTME